MATSNSETAPKQPFWHSPRLWIALAIVAAAAIFITQNRDIVVIQLLMFQIKAPNWITLVSIFLAGMGTAWLLARRRR